MTTVWVSEWERDPIFIAKQHATIYYINYLYSWSYKHKINFIERLKVAVLVLCAYLGTNMF